MFPYTNSEMKEFDRNSNLLQPLGSSSALDQSRMLGLPGGSLPDRSEAEGGGALVGQNFPH